MAGRYSVHFGETRDALHHFHETGTAQIVEAVRARLFGQSDAVPVFHDKTRELWGNFNYFIDSDSALVAFFALLAPLRMRFEYLKALLDVVRSESLGQQRFLGYLQRFLAAAAQPTSEALRNDQVHGRREVEGRNTHVSQARQRFGGGVRVERRQHEVTRLCRLHGNLRRLQVADLADHHDVGVLAQERAERRSEIETHFVVDV